MAVVQLVRASDCGSECRGFESHLPPSQKEEILIEFPLFIVYKGFTRSSSEILGQVKKYVDIIFEKHLKGQSEIECFSQRCHYNICAGSCVRTCSPMRTYV